MTLKRDHRTWGSDTAGFSQSVHAARFYLRNGKLYLHWSGSKLTDNPDHAWIGSVEQARACRRTFDAAAGCKMAGVSA